MSSPIKVLCSGNVAVDFYRESRGLSLSENFQVQALAHLPPKVFLGGKAMNFASAFSQCGVETWFHGSVGNDLFGDWAIQQATLRGINTEFIMKSEHPTMAFSIDVNDNDSIPEPIYKDHASLKLPIDRLGDGALKAFDSVVLHATSAWDDLLSLCHELKKTNSFVVFNPAPNFNLKSLDPLDAAHMIVANKIEAQKILLMIPGNKASPSVKEQNLAQEIGRAFGKTCIVTLGENGVVAYDGHKLWYCSVLPSRIVDTVGAGDSFLGYTISSILRGNGLGQAIRIGQIAAGKTCEQRGAYMHGLSYEMVTQEINQVTLTELSP